MLSLYRTLYFSICIALWLCISVNSSYGETKSSWLNGDDLKAIYNEDDFVKGKLIIEVSKGYPGPVFEKTKVPNTNLAVAKEGVGIFGDGECFSKRDCIADFLGTYIPEWFQPDETWTSFNAPRLTYMRNCEYWLSSKQIKEILQLLASYDGELSPGDMMLGVQQCASVRILYKGREGFLFEMLGYRIEDQEKLAIIDTILDTVRQFESCTELNILEYDQLVRELTAKREAYDWVHVDWKKCRVFRSLKEAWDAHGIAFDWNSVNQ